MKNIVNWIGHHCVAMKLGSDIDKQLAISTRCDVVLNCPCGREVTQSCGVSCSGFYFADK